MSEHAYHQFALTGADLAYRVRNLAGTDREPLEARIAQAHLMFVVGEQTDAYQELGAIGREAERIDVERGLALAVLPGTRASGCLSGL